MGRVHNSVTYLYGTLITRIPLTPHTATSYRLVGGRALPSSNTRVPPPCVVQGSISMPTSGAIYCNFNCIIYTTTIQQHTTTTFHSLDIFHILDIARA